MNKLLVIVAFSFVFLALFAQNAMAINTASGNPVRVKVGVWLVNVEKVDLSANSYRLDFYLWFRFNPSEISLAEVKDFESINRAPTRYEVYVIETEGYLEYRVRGDFIKTFDFSQYSSETHELSVR